MFLTEGLVEELVFVSFLRFVCCCLGCFISKSKRMLYCYFDVCLTVCSVLNLVELLRRAPASARNRSPAYLFRRASDCWSWHGADTQGTRPGGS